MNVQGWAKLLVRPSGKKASSAGEEDWTARVKGSIHSLAAAAAQGVAEVQAALGTLLEGSKQQQVRAQAITVLVVSPESGPCHVPVQACTGLLRTLHCCQGANCTYLSPLETLLSVLGVLDGAFTAADKHYHKQAST